MEAGLHGIGEGRKPIRGSQWGSSEPGSVAKLDLLQSPALPLTSYMSLNMLVSLSLGLLICNKAAITEPLPPGGVVSIYSEQSAPPLDHRKCPQRELEEQTSLDYGGAWTNHLKYTVSGQGEDFRDTSNTPSGL